MAKVLRPYLAKAAAAVAAQLVAQTQTLEPLQDQAVYTAEVVELAGAAKQKTSAAKALFG